MLGCSFVLFLFKTDDTTQGHFVDVTAAWKTLDQCFRHHRQGNNFLDASCSFSITVNCGPCQVTYNTKVSANKKEIPREDFKTIWNHFGSERSFYPLINKRNLSTRGRAPAPTSPHKRWQSIKCTWNIYDQLKLKEKCTYTYVCETWLMLPSTSLKKNWCENNKEGLLDTVNLQVPTLCCRVKKQRR